MVHSRFGRTQLLDTCESALTLDTIISKLQPLQNGFIRLALRLPKYISVKLLHNSSGLPYVKDRLLSCAARTSDRISKNPSVKEWITFNRVNPAWDRFPTPLSDPSGQSLTYRGNFVSQVMGSLRGHPSISYIWLDSLTAKRVTGMLIRGRFQSTQKKTGFKFQPPKITAFWFQKLMSF